MPLLKFEVHADYEEVVRLRKEIDRLEDALRGFGPGAAESTIRSLQDQLSRCRDQFRGLVTDAADAGQQVERTLRTQLASARRNAGVNVRVTADTADFRRKNAEVMRDIDDSLDKLQEYGQQFSGLFSRFAGFTGLAVAGMGAVEFAHQIKNVRGEFQQLEVAFETMLGNKEKSDALMTQLIHTVAITPFGMNEVTNGAKQLLAYGVACEDVNDKLVQLGDIAAGLSLSMGDLVYLYGTTMVQGRMFTQDLRQFQGRGIPIAKELAKQFGVAESKVGELVTAGKVTAKEFKQAIESMAGAGGQFGGLMEKQSKTISGQISNIGDAIEQMFNEIGKSSEGVITTALEGTSWLVENWKKVGTALGLVAAAYTGFRLGDALDTKLVNSQMEETQQRLRELERTARDFRLDDDIQRAVDKRLVSVEDATEWQTSRDALKENGAQDKTLEQLKEEAKLRIAVAEAIDAEAERLAKLNEEHSKEGENQPEPIKLDSDLSEFVANGTATQEQAEQLQQMRDATKEIWEAKMQELAAAEKEVTVGAELNDQAQEALKAAQERKDKADELVDMLTQQKELQEQMEASGIDVADDEKVTDLEIEAAMREQAAAAAELQTASVEAETAAGMQNEAIARSQAISQEAAAISQEQAAAAAATNTAATNANTGATAGNTAATRTNSLVTSLAATKDKIAAGMKLMLSNAINQVRNSLHSLKMAILTNPIGMLVTAVTAAIGVFMAFRKEEEETTQEMERFGESAVKTKNNAEMLYSVLSSVDSSSKTYRDSLSELEKIAKEYGIVLDDEKDKYEQLIEKRGLLIKLIQEEGRQRQIANNIATYQKEQADAASDFREKLIKSIKDENDDHTVQANASILASSIMDKVESKREEVMDTISVLDQKERELAIELAKGKFADIADVARLRREVNEERTQLIGDLNADARKILEAQGKRIGEDWQLDINDIYGFVKEYTKQLDASQKGMAEYVELQKKNKEELEKNTPKPKIDYSQLDVNTLVDKYKEAESAAKELNGTKIAPPSDPVNINRLIAAAETAKEKADAVTDSVVSPDADTSRIEDTTAKATEAEEKLRDVDNAEATPYIDTKYLDIALSKLGDIKIAMREVGGQTLNTTSDERRQLKRLIDTYGENGKIPAGKMLPKEDADLYNGIVRKARLRSNLKFGGKTYSLSPQQSAVLQQLVDEYGTKLNEDEMKPEGARLYRQLKYDLRMGDAKKGGADAAKAMSDVLSEFDSRIKKAKSSNEISQLRKELQSKSDALDPDEKLYKELDKRIKALDKKDPKKKGGGKDDPKQREYDARKAREQEQLRQEEMRLKREQEREELAIKMMRDGSEKEIAEVRLSGKKKRAAIDDEKRKEAQRLKDIDKQNWLRGSKSRKAYDWKQEKTDAEYEQIAFDNLGLGTRLSEAALEESLALQEVYRKDFESMREYLKEYGTFEQRKLAITQEYGEKIRKSASEGERLSLQKQMTEAVQNVEAEAISAKIDWYSVFDSAGIILRGQLEPMYRQLREYVKTDAFKKDTATNQKAIIEAMERLRGQLGETQGFSDLAEAITAYQGALAQLNAATERNTAALEQQRELDAAFMAAEENLRKAAGQNYEAIVEAQNALAEARRKGDAEAAGAAEGALNSLLAMGDANSILEALVALGKARDDISEFGARLAQSADEVSGAQAVVSSAGMQLSQTAKNVTQPVSEIYTFLDNYGMSSLAGLWQQIDRVKGAMEGLKAIKKAGEAGKDVEDVADKIADGADDAAKELGDKLPDDFIEGLDAAGLYGQIVSAVMSILDMVKDGVGPLVSSMIDNVFNGINGLLDNTLSGQFAVQIGESLYKGVTGLFHSITTLGGALDWWGNGESDKDLEKDMERLSLSNDALRRAVEDLTDEMREASVAEKAGLYATSRENIEESMRNTQQMMQRAAKAYSNGTAGIGGSHSSNTKIDKAMSAKEWKRISEITGSTVKSAGDFWKLTSEQMAKVAKDAPDLYAKIKTYADDGHKDAAQYMDEYIDYYKQLEELEESYRESLTDVGLDSIEDAFKSQLLDMESDAASFADNFESMMQQAVINGMMTDVFNDRIKEWYKAFSDSMQSGNKLSASEQEKLKKQWDTIVGDALSQRDELSKAMGWDTSATQQASARSVQGMSQDTGDAIEGRLTAMQIAVESIRGCEQSQCASLAQLTNAALQVMQSESQTSARCAGIEQQIVRCYLELADINASTRAVVKPIQEMQLDIAQIKRNTEKL